MGKVDDILLSKRNPEIKLEPEKIDDPNVATPHQDSAPDTIEEKSHEQPIDEYSQKDEGENVPLEAENHEEDKSDQDIDKETHSADEESDEYGTAIKKQTRTYTEEDVQRMIRERMERFARSNQQTQEEIKNPVHASSPEAGEDWQAELETFVENVVEKRQQKSQEKEIKAKIQAKQQEFEDKFTKGAERYSDFEKVTYGAPITNPIMHAAMDMKDPAAFIYNASKNHRAELERISKLENPFQQAMEVGKLHATMVKAKNITKASKPITRHQGDVSSAYIPKKSLDDRIKEYAEKNMKQR
jgi:hypothetical protein